MLVDNGAETSVTLRNPSKRFWVENFADLIDRLSGWLSAFGVASIFCMILLEVGSRYFFNSPTSWVTEISTYTVIAVTYIGAAYAHRQNAHVRVEFFLDSRPETSSKKFKLIAAWLGVTFVLFAAWQCALYTYSEYIHGARSYIISVPKWIPNFPIAIGLIGFAMSMFREILELGTPNSVIRRNLVPVIAIITGVCLCLFGLRPPMSGLLEIDWGSLLLVAAILICAAAWSGWQVAFGSLAIGVVAALLFLFARDLQFGWTITLLFGTVLAIFFLGVRIALGLGLLAVIGLYFLLPFPLPGTIAERAVSSLDSFSLTAVPMFVLMGTLLLRSGIASEMFDAMLHWMGRLPGGIAHASIASCTLFAAVSGSSLATAATMGTIACPEMIKRGYGPRLTYGAVAAGGTLGILIPPSIAMILYGTIVGVSVSQLFMAGIIPGVILAVSLMGVVFIWSVIKPEAAPRGSRSSWSVRFKTLKGTVPFLGLILTVLGSLYLGIVTPTEAGAVGAVLALGLCLLRRSISLGDLSDIFKETAKVTAFLMLIIVAASLFSYIFDNLRLSSSLLESVVNSDAAPWIILGLIALMYLILGMFIDPISILVMTLPVTYPIVVSLGFDPVWFGVVLVLLIEIGLVTPPVGINLFVLRGINPSISLMDISIGVLPFIAVILLNILLLSFLPEIVTFLPGLMK